MQQATTFSSCSPPAYRRARPSFGLDIMHSASALQAVVCFTSLGMEKILHRGCYQYRAALVFTNSLCPIDDQVHNELLHLAGIRFDGRQLGIEFELQLYILGYGEPVTGSLPP